MDYVNRYKELNAQFCLGKDTVLPDTNVGIRFFHFSSRPLSLVNNKIIVAPADDMINENLSFLYPVFVPAKYKTTDKAILLLHGLNERNWSKYLTWAEFLCVRTGKPVILFPIAFHMNRSPVSWSNPRELQQVLEIRRRQNGDDRSLSFANVALSKRISEHPHRFYSSGRQSVSDLTYLVSQIKEGNHELFCENTQIDIFSYSIGAFLSEILLMANPGSLFTDSKLFLFCGGGIFSSMMGESRSIMDKSAFDVMYNFYMKDFKSYNFNENDTASKAFDRMISPERDKNERERFFRDFGTKLSGVSLVNDIVMPFWGVEEALGKETADSRMELLDFPFLYTHENPFPVNGKNTVDVNRSFNRVFEKAAQFFV